MSCTILCEKWTCLMSVLHWDTYGYWVNPSILAGKFHIQENFYI